MNNCESRVLYHKEKNIVLLGNLQIKDINYDGFSLIHPNSIIWEGNNWDSIFDMALDKLFSITNNDTLYYLNMDFEVSFLLFWKRVGFINYLERKFKGRKLIFSDSNTHPNKDEIPFEWDSVNFFFGRSGRLTNRFPVGPRVFSRNFICLQCRPTLSRRNIYSILYENNLLHKTFYSFAPHDVTEPMHSKIDDGTEFNNYFEESEQGFVDKVPTMFAPVPQCRFSFCNIITESTFYDEYDLQDVSINKIFITEKTEKVFTAAQSFILVGNPNSLKYLKSMGFKTFDKWWDESYDTILDHNHRMLEIEKLIKEIGSWSLKKCERIHVEMADVLSHNQSRNKKLYQEISKKYFRTEYEWLTF